MHNKDKKDHSIPTPPKPGHPGQSNPDPKLDPKRENPINPKTDDSDLDPRRKSP